MISEKNFKRKFKIEMYDSKSCEVIVLFYRPLKKVVTTTAPPVVIEGEIVNDPHDWA